MDDTYFDLGDFYAPPPTEPEGCWKTRLAAWRGLLSIPDFISWSNGFLTDADLSSGVED